MIIAACLNTAYSAESTNVDQAVQEFLRVKTEFLQPSPNPSGCFPTEEMAEKMNSEKWVEFYRQNTDPRHPQWKNFLPWQKFTWLGNPIDNENSYQPAYDSYPSYRKQFAVELAVAVNGLKEVQDFTSAMGEAYARGDLKLLAKLADESESFQTAYRRDKWVAFYKAYPDPLHLDWNFEGDLKDLDFTPQGWPIIM